MLRRDQNTADALSFLFNNLTPYCIKKNNAVNLSVEVLCHLKGLSMRRNAKLVCWKLIATTSEIGSDI